MIAGTAGAGGRIGGCLAVALGLLMGLSLVKFGNPAILDHLIVAPKGGLELFFQAWPLAWGYSLYGLVLALGLLVAWSFRGGIPKPWWLAWLPGVWLVWQGVVSGSSIAPALTHATLVYFAFLVAGFYLGLVVLGPLRRGDLFWGAVLPGFCLMLWTGFEQHFGGLEATRRFIYAQPGWERLPAEHLKRLGSDRIFATLLYPNTLAGALLLYTPPLVVVVWRLSARLTVVTRWVLSGLLGGGSLACLFWSGSKAGWLIAMVMAVVSILSWRGGGRWRAWVLAILVIGGAIGFVTRFGGYLRKGAPSVSARMDYWRAAWGTMWEHPLTGTGPGTFSVAYRRVKPPEAEMARLAHNDYLEQGSDSGLVGVVLYVGTVFGVIGWLYGRCREDKLRHGAWLGLLGWGLQGMTEFGLYIPALGWMAFLVMGWLWGEAVGAARTGKRVTDGCGVNINAR